MVMMITMTMITLTRWRSNCYLEFQRITCYNRFIKPKNWVTYGFYSASLHKIFKKNIKNVKNKHKKTIFEIEEEGIALCLLRRLSTTFS